ncbi:MAG: lysylphosphatidylglycerol synthase transmembrane domain-containing protein [Bacteroidales bacterium]
MKHKKKQLILVFKIIVSLFALYAVYKNISIEELKAALGDANQLLLIAALLLYAFSKIVSSFRLNVYFRQLPIDISERENLRLYWLGMFYNLFLPGGIGGDGYKIYLINKVFSVKLKKATSSVLLDRLNGMTAILYILPVSFLFVPIQFMYKLLVPVVILAGYAMYLVFLKLVFPSFVKSEPRCSIYSLVVQGLQCIAIFAILASLGITKDYAEYTILFLISSLVSVLPVSIGGIGIRELVFLTGSNYFGLNSTISVMVSFLFYLINVVVSGVGVYYHFKGFELKSQLKEITVSAEINK